MQSLHNGPFVRKIQSRNPSEDWHRARPFPESSALCIHKSGVLLNFPSLHPPFPDLQKSFWAWKEVASWGADKRGDGEGSLFLLLFHPGRGMRELGLGAGDGGGRHLGGEEGAGPDSRCGHCGRVMVTFPARKSDLAEGAACGRGESENVAETLVLEERRITSPKASLSPPPSPDER